MKHYFPTPLVLALAADAAFADWFGDWGTNRDNRLNEEKFGAGYAQDGVYDDWGVDGDDSLRKDELRGALYESKDTDNDSYLADDEWDTGWLDV